MCLEVRDRRLFVKQVVRVTVTPVFARFERLHDGVLRVVVMLGRVLVRGRIAAAHMAAFQTKTQMHPSAADPQAILAAVGARGHGMDLLNVFAILH
jgi:hypothetical protein